MALESYRELRAWQQAMDLAEQCYLVTKSFPREEMFGMVMQIRRAAASVPANIAEGYGRGHRAEYVRFSYIARGSLKELETRLLLSSRVGLVGAGAIDPVLERCDVVGKMLWALIRSLERSAEG